VDGVGGCDREERWEDASGWRERIEKFDDGCERARRWVTKPGGRRDEEQEVQGGDEEVAAGCEGAIVPTGRHASAVASGDQQDRRDDRQQDQEADEEDERPGEGERAAHGTERVLHADDHPEGEKQDEENGEEAADDDVAPEQPRPTGAKGVGKGAEESAVGGGLFGHILPSHGRDSAHRRVSAPVASGVGRLLPGPRDRPRMQVDIGNALASVADPGVARDALESLDDRVAAADDRIQGGIDDGAFGYAALNLPERTDPAAIRAAVEPVADAEAVLTVGIGGSALGATTISSALGPSDVTHRVLDNVDPEHTSTVLADLPLAETAVHVVSRSGTTAETLATFLVVREAMATAGVDWTERTVVTTGESGPLRELVGAHDLPATDVPAGVPGRFAALSAVGLVPAAIRGHDIEALLDGASQGREALAPSLFDCPAYAYGAIAYALDQRGAGTNAMMPYAEGLESFAEWFAQLWAESLGKDGRGQTPVRALGATDQHSQLQLYRAGPRDKLVTLLRPTERTDRSIPETDVADLAYLGGQGLGDLLDAEFEATEASLAAAGVPNVRLEIDGLDARNLGRLLFDMEAACILAGELYDVDTFTQPAVEWGKRAARGLLGGGEFEEADAVAEKTRLFVAE
jgi:glucose-6-phosphate isomerase